jgi:hypothetical protein
MGDRCIEVILADGAYQNTSTLLKAALSVI